MNNSVNKSGVSVGVANDSAGNILFSAKIQDLVDYGTGE